MNTGKSYKRNSFGNDAMKMGSNIANLSGGYLS